MTTLPTVETIVESEKDPLTNELVKLILRFLPEVPSSDPSIAPITVAPVPVPLNTELPTTEIAFKVLFAVATFWRERISVAAGEVIEKVILCPA